ncbi:J domain-containing protein [Salinicola endophyticus]|nr:J domain-containing protein [Salinicola endophyticus]
MVATGFSAFESLLVKSPHQRESAELLLLCWVFANKHVPLDEDRRYLERLAARAHHRRDLETLLAAARRQDLGDVQLAAEVLTKEQTGPIIAFLRQAVVLATSDGALSLRNHHILRFLADLSGVSPDALRALYREVTGRTLAAPEDLSHRSHWQPVEPEAEDTAEVEEGDTGSTQANAGEYRGSWRDRVRRLAENQWREHKQQQQWRRQQAQQAREREQQREAAAQAERERRAQAHAKRQAEAQAQQREQARRQAEAEALRREQAQRQREQAQRQREEAAQRQRQEQQQRQYQERQRRERQRQEQESQHQEQQRQWQREQSRQRQRAGFDAPSYPIRRALIELELDTSASPREIKLAYRRLAQRHHPDRFHGQSEWRINLASQRFQRIKNAYDLLMQHA